MKRQAEVLQYLVGNGLWEAQRLPGLAHSDGRAGQPSGGSDRGLAPCQPRGSPAPPGSEHLRLPRLSAAPHAPTATCRLPKRPPQPLKVSGPQGRAWGNWGGRPEFPPRRRPQPGAASASRFSPASPSALHLASLSTPARPGHQNTWRGSEVARRRGRACGRPCRVERARWARLRSRAEQARVSSPRRPPRAGSRVGGARRKGRGAGREEEREPRDGACAVGVIRALRAGWTLLSKMATEEGGKEMNEIKTQFTTREGLYKLLPHSEYSRPNRVLLQLAGL